MASPQERRVAQLNTPLGRDALLVRSVSGVEGINDLFRFRVAVSGDPRMIEQAELLGEAIQLRIDLAGDRDRWVHGYVTRLVQTEAPGTGREGGASYELEVRPWLWMLTQRTDSRIFQEMSIPDIVKQVFDGLGFTDYEFKLNAGYEPLVNCVQYQESDFDFVARLLEQEGIFWYFRHEENRHTLVLHDSVDNIEPLPEATDVEMWHGGAITSAAEERINTWEVTRVLLPGKYAMTDYNFQDPTTDLAVDAKSSQTSTGSEQLEIFEYPGDFVNLGAEEAGKLDKGEGRVRLRQEEGDARKTLATATGTVRAITPGYQIALRGHPVDSYNADWMIVQAEHEISEEGSLALDDDFLIRYRNTFRAVPLTVAFRPRRRTPRPRISGPQTAVVVGPQGEELYVDKFGRVKVQFHWDRYGQKDENSSCWVRVSQHWAGKGWGTVYHPRIGQEVIVEFLEGNPDRPLITGRVYNGMNPIPYSSPTQSGILTRSTKEGSASTANELRFDDNKGSEEVYLHAEKHMNRVVESSDTENIGVNQTSKVGSNKTTTVGKNLEQTVGENRTMTIGKNLSETIGEAMSVTVGKAKSETIGEASSVTIAKAHSVTVGENESHSIGKNLSEEVAENYSLNVGKNLSISIGSNRTVEVGKNDQLKAKKITIEAADEIQIKAGKSKIIMKKDGTVTIEGKDITIKGSGAIGVKASKDVTIKGTKIVQN